VAGGEGTYPVTNPARPAEVVFDAPGRLAGPARPGGGGRPPGVPAWAALQHGGPGRVVIAAAEAGVAAVERQGPGPAAHPGARQGLLGGGLRRRTMGGMARVRTHGGRGAGR
jgi:hypothetical protein